MEKDLFPQEEEKKVPDYEQLQPAGLLGAIKKSKLAKIVIAGAFLFFIFSLYVRNTEKQTPQQRMAEKQKQQTLAAIQPASPQVLLAWRQQTEENARKEQEAKRQADIAQQDLESTKKEIEYEKQKQANFQQAGYYQPGYQQPVAGPAQPSPTDERKKREQESLGADSLVASFRKPQTASIASATGIQPVSYPQPSESTQERSAPTADEKKSAILTQNQFSGPTYVLPEGTILESMLVNRLRGEFPSQVLCRASQDVWSLDGQHLLIPAGSMWIGEARPVSALDQRGLAVTFSRIRMGDLYSQDLTSFAGLNQQGATGLTGKVNSHYPEIFGASLAVGALGAIAQLGNNSYGGINGIDPSTQMRNGISQSMSQSGTHILDRFLNKLPTVTIPEGSRVRIILAADLAFPDYRNHHMTDELPAQSPGTGSLAQREER